MKVFFVAFWVIAFCGSCSATSDPSRSEKGFESDATDAEAVPDTDVGISILRDGVYPEPEHHRADPARYENFRPPFNEGADGANCEVDDDCQDGLNGRCVTGQIPYCSYDDCLSDGDCSATQACVCDAGVAAENRCLSGDCRTDSDCPETEYCSPSYGDCGDYNGFVTLHCRTLQDECVGDSDCEGRGFCGYLPSAERWVCRNIGCNG